MKLHLTVLIAALLLSTGLEAQTVYRWTDSDGQVHYGHSVPLEHRARGYDRLGPDGSVVEHIEPEMTPEERVAHAAQLALQAELEAEQESQAARDRLLLAAYRSEQDLKDSLERRLDNLALQRHAIETSLDHARGRFESLVTQAALLNRRDEPVPESLQDSIDAARAEVRRLQQAIDEIGDRKAETSARFEADLDRWRGLRGTPR